MSHTTRVAKYTARQPHTCTVCGTQILPGERYARQVTFSDGTVCTWKLHLSCLDAMEQAHQDDYGDIDGFISPDDVVAWATEHHGLYSAAAELVCRIRDARAQPCADRAPDPEETHRG